MTEVHHSDAEGRRASGCPDSSYSGCPDSSYLSVSSRI